MKNRVTRDLNLGAIGQHCRWCIRMLRDAHFAHLLEIQHSSPKRGHHGWGELRKSPQSHKFNSYSLSRALNALIQFIPYSSRPITRSAARTAMATSDTRGLVIGQVISARIAIAIKVELICLRSGTHRDIDTKLGDYFIDRFYSENIGVVICAHG